MNWYTTMKKIAFPFGRIKCINPRCKKTIPVDFGFKDMSQGGSSTQNLQDGSTPFINMENKQYEEPIDGVHSDQVESGTITAECPHCHQNMEVSYEWDTASPEAQGNDFFSQVKITDIEPLSKDLAQQYNGVGMTPGMAIPDLV